VNAEQVLNEKPLRNAFSRTRKPSFRLLDHPSSGTWNTVSYTHCTLHWPRVLLSDHRYGTRSPRFSEASVMARLPLEMWSHTHVVDRGGHARLVELDGQACAQPHARHMSPRPTGNALIVCDPRSVCVGRKNEYEPRGVRALLGQGSRQKRGASRPHSLVMCGIMTQTRYFPSQAQTPALIGKPSSQATGGLVRCRPVSTSGNATQSSELSAHVGEPSERIALMLAA